MDTTLAKVLTLSLAAILGVNARYWIGAYIQTQITGAFPWEILLINLSGSFFMGALVGLTSTRFQGETANQLRFIVGTGFLGTYTTFSAFSSSTVTLKGDDQTLFAVANIVLSVGGGCLVAWLGYTLSKAL